MFRSAFLADALHRLGCPEEAIRRPCRRIQRYRMLGAIPENARGSGWGLVDFSGSAKDSGSGHGVGLIEWFSVRVTATATDWKSCPGQNSQVSKGWGLSIGYVR